MKSTIVLRRSYLFLRSKLKIFFYFITPNIKYLFSGRLKAGRFPICEQKVFLTGSGKIEIGEFCMLGYKLGGFNRGGSVEIQPRYLNSLIRIGKGVKTNNNVFICAANQVEIGDNTLIGQNVSIFDHEAHGVQPDKRNEIGVIGRVIIGENVWIGNNVIILTNTEIGNNTIIAAGSVVKGSFPGNIIIGGVPAREIKSI